MQTESGSLDVRAAQVRTAQQQELPELCVHRAAQMSNEPGLGHFFIFLFSSVQKDLQQGYGHCRNDMWRTTLTTQL
jgi:hypothetical protein